MRVVDVAFSSDLQHGRLPSRPQVACPVRITVSRDFALRRVLWYEYAVREFGISGINGHKLQLA
jgi:hypothetical protein